jgi:hypothetical protein
MRLETFNSSKNTANRQSISLSGIGCAPVSFYEIEFP